MRFQLFVIFSFWHILKLAPMATGYIPEDWDSAVILLLLKRETPVFWVCLPIYRLITIFSRFYSNFRVEKKSWHFDQ